MSTKAIDCHVHLYPPEVNRDPAKWAAAEREQHWAALCTRRRRDGRPVQSFPELGELLRAMDEAGVERAVLLGWYWQNSANCARQNRFYAECVKSHPDRLAAFAALQPAAGEDEVCGETERARDQGLIGLGELSPASQGYRADHPGFRAALARAAQWGWPVNLHVTDPRGKPYPGRVETPLEEFLALADAFPETTFILSHWGGLLPLRLPAAAARPNIYYDTAASPLLYGTDVWTEFTGATGFDRVLFGSDHPLNLYPKDECGPSLARFVGEAGRHLPEAARAAVLRGNAERILALPVDFQDCQDRKNLAG
jgi:uncharacterized protein